MAPKGRRPVRSGGYSLIEFLIYVAVLAVVMGVAFSAFYRGLEGSRDITRISDDIIRVLQAGEQWRTDIRAAVAAPVLIEEGELSACEIPGRNGSVAYVFSNGAVWRKVPGKPAAQLLGRVARSEMAPDQRAQVASWRWELELRPKRRTARVRPMFTFQAVPQGRER